MRSLIPLLLAALVSAQSHDPEAIVPTPKAPFVQPEATARPLLARAIRDYMERAPGTFGAHPAAASFPGAVTASERVTREVGYDPNRIHRWDASAGNAPNLATGPESWQDTGLYAAPGETVVIEVPAPPAGRKLKAIIGCHRDNLLRLDTWKRFPVVTRSFDLRPGRNEVANAFGGLIFLQVLGDPGVAVDAAAPLTVANAVAAPVYRLGADTPETWASSLAAPAPWATLVGKRAVLHVESSAARKVADPGPLLEYWDRVLEVQDDFVGLGRLAPERVVPDIQISAGWMHSGYPFMCHLRPSQGHMLDLARLRREGDWGFFHELGHNHQRRDWTFAGQVEVTVNWFSLICMEQLVGKPLGQGHPSLRDLDGLLRARFGSPPNLGPFEQLAPFVALARAHGWEPLRRTLRSYKDESSERAGARDAAAQQDLFVRRYGTFAQADVADLFAAMGYAVSDATRSELARFPRATVPHAPEPAAAR